MASLPKPAPVRRLSELLKEKQEPFLLDVYLLEKGYPKKSSHSENENRYHLGKSSKKLSSSGLSSRKEGLHKSSNLLKSVLSLTRLVSGKNSKSFNGIGKAYDGGRFDALGNASGIWKKTQVAELNRLSLDSRRLDSSSTPESTFSSSDGHRALNLCTSKEQAAAGREFQWGCTEDCRQFSPVSILEVSSDEGSPGQHKLFSPGKCKEESTSTSSLNLPKEGLEHSILSASFWDVIVHTMKEKHGLELLGSCLSFQCMKTKRVLERKKQLLLDCVREVVGNYGIQSRRWNAHEYLGPEMLGKIICDKILSWSKQDGDVTNITQLLESDFKDSSKQWNHFRHHIKEIGIEMGDGILENIIDEIVTEMLDFLG